MGLEKQICVVSSQENHLSSSSSEWRCGGGYSPSMGKPKEEEVALCGWSVKKKLARAFTKGQSRTSTEKVKEEIYKSMKPCRGIFGKGRETCLALLLKKKSLSKAFLVLPVDADFLYLCKQ